MEWQARLLEHSILRLAPVGETVAARFYETLLHDFPELRHLFQSTSLTEQHQKLWSTLQLMAKSFRSPGQLTETLLKLGAKHKTYGVRPQDYDTVRVTLLKVLEEFLGEEWTPEMQLAWSLALFDVSQIMLQGANSTNLTVAPH